MVRISFLISICAVFVVFTGIAQTGENQFDVERMVVAYDVEDREPVEIAETFPIGIDRVYSFLEARNIEQDTEVTFVWYHGEDRAAAVTVGLGQGPRWRTFSYVTIGDRSGDWRVELRDATDNIVQSVNFRIE